MRIAFAISFVLLSSLEASRIAPADQPKTVTVYFIRHAQSFWNLKKAMKAMKAMNNAPGDMNTEEKKLWNGGNGDYGNNTPDVGLTERGFEQVKKLRDWWEAQSRCDDGTKCGECAENAVQCMAKQIRENAVKKCSAKTTKWFWESECIADDIWNDPNYESHSSSDKSATQNCTSTDPKSLSGSINNVVFGVSNLKRAIETMLVFISGLGLSKEQKPVLHIVSHLQETSAGEDAQTTLEKQKAPFSDRDDGGYSSALRYFGLNQGQSVPVTFDVTENTGNQQFGGIVGSIVGFGSRLDRFCGWLDTMADDQHKTFVLSGHSSFLMDFFKHFLKDKKHKKINLAEKILLGGKGTGLKLKLGNASMIRFQLKFVEGKCQIVQKQTQLLYGEWQVQGEVEGNSETVGLRNFVGQSIEYREGRKDLRGTCPKPSGGD